ncbi:hypothetical protein [Streptomyces sp. CBMA29]|uniref:hypothetical protein n=1 Tax=Streptomyces sp. CBMA29 TaxID=1896314 RepID=UPI0016619126|nr:hypothetical protein [Streptomyces sp. CBMA29]MBD0734101.1 hypothetical protein [Streptomyces sp. CBMA29]
MAMFLPVAAEAAEGGTAALAGAGGAGAGAEGAAGGSRMLSGLQFGKGLGSLFGGGGKGDADKGPDILSAGADWERS